MKTEERITANVIELIDLTLNSGWEAAFGKFYHEELEKTDLDGIVVKGKESNLQNGRIFSSKISKVRDFSCAGYIVKNNRSFVSWSIDFDVDGKPLKVVEIAIQDWEDGKIIRERFFA